MVLNDLVDSFCYSLKNAGLKGLTANSCKLFFKISKQFHKCIHVSITENTGTILSVLETYTLLLLRSSIVVHFFLIPQYLHSLLLPGNNSDRIQTSTQCAQWSQLVVELGVLHNRAL